MVSSTCCYRILDKGLRKDGLPKVNKSHPVKGLNSTNWVSKQELLVPRARALVFSYHLEQAEHSVIPGFQVCHPQSGATHRVSLSFYLAYCRYTAFSFQIFVLFLHNTHITHTHTYTLEKPSHQTSQVWQEYQWPHAVWLSHKGS